MEPIISILNLKNGVGTSALAWNIAHILELDIYQHDKAMHHLFLEERNSRVYRTKSISVSPINKREFKSGVYDLGADINYGYVRQIISRSTVVVIPLEVGAEVLIKTIATIRFVTQHNKECDIFVVFNKLDNSDPKREHKYTRMATSKIKNMNSTVKERIHFYHIRYAFAIFRNLDEGYCLLDNYLSPNTPKVGIGNFELLQHLRYYTLDKEREQERQNKKSKLKKDNNDFYKDTKPFYDDHKPFYEDFKSCVDVSLLFDSKFIGNNTKILKDMLILTTYIKGHYSRTWEGK